MEDEIIIKLMEDENITKLFKKFQPLCIFRSMIHYDACEPSCGSECCQRFCPFMLLLLLKKMEEE